MTVVWAESAVEQLMSVHDYLAQTSPQYASYLVDRITSRSKQIAAFPFSGRMVPEYGRPQIREIIENHYRILYHLRADRIEIIAVVHSRQHVPSTEEND